MCPSGSPSTQHTPSLSPLSLHHQHNTLLPSHPSPFTLNTPRSLPLTPVTHMQIGVLAEHNEELMKLKHAGPWSESPRPSLPMYTKHPKTIHRMMIFLLGADVQGGYQFRSTHTWQGRNRRPAHAQAQS